MAEMATSEVAQRFNAAIEPIDGARQHGLLVNRTDQKVVRMLPPLTIAAGEIDRALDILDGVFAEVSAEVHA